MATEPYESHTEPEALIPNRLIELAVTKGRLERDVVAYLTARQGFWYCLRHGQLRAWWRFL